MVRNLADRRVEVIAEGPKEGLVRLLRRLRQGPPDAEVTSVAVEWEPVRSEYVGFGIE
jgi:acylphosphatase